MNLLIAPDSLKDSISSIEFCKIIKELINDNWPKDNLTILPLADGGEGTVDALIYSSSGKFIKKRVTGPLGSEIEAKYGLLSSGKTAIIEMASASGLQLVPLDKRNPMLTTTYGTGELILDAINKGVRKIIIGIGGSATNDAGIGMMQALGYKCLDLDNKEVPYGGNGLIKLNKIIKAKNNILKNIEIEVACDVNNVISGKNGAAFVYAKQKGADNEMVSKLDKGLINFTKCVKKDLNIDVSDLKGGGAAGGLGAGIFASLNGILISGFEIIRKTLKLDDILNENIDLIITGEGEINEQSLNGKLPIELAKLGKKNDIPTIVFVGIQNVDLEKLKKHGIIGVFSIVNGPTSLNNSIENTESLLKEKAYNLLNTIHNIKC